MSEEDGGGVFERWFVGVHRPLGSNRDIQATQTAPRSIGTEITDAFGCGIGFQPVVVGTQAGSLCRLFRSRC